MYKYLIENNILYSKQFGFQNSHSTDNVVVQLIDQIIESFENNEYTRGVFIDLSKAFDTVGHSILLKKLKLWGITDTNQEWFKSHLSNRRQFIQIGEKRTSSETVSSGSILGPLLFLLYVNDLKNASNIFDLIMFADDTNFFLHNKILDIYFFLILFFVTFFIVDNTNTIY